MGFVIATPSDLQVHGLYMLFTKSEASSADQSQLLLKHTQFLRETLQNLLRDPTPNPKDPVAIPGLWQKWKECETRSGSQVLHQHPW